MGDAYRETGVDYEVLDRAKRSAIAAAAATAPLLAARGGRSIEGSRGEPAFGFEVGDLTLALVTECLGTKSLVARAYGDDVGTDYFEAVGYDTVAAIVNDVICVGALPLVVNAYFATGAPTWLSTGSRFESLVTGFRRACEDSGAVWGGGETPTLADIITNTEIDLAGAAIGRVPDGRQVLLGDRLEPGDAIVFLASTGIHTNGVSLARRVAASLPLGFATPLPSGRAFGDALLTPSQNYVRFVEALFESDVRPSYLTHVTGHGFRKLMRANRALRYRITRVPTVPEVLTFLVDQARLTAADAYGTLNMGVGFVVYCRDEDVPTVLATARAQGLDATVTGVVEDGPREVVIDEMNVTYTDEDLQLR